MQAEAARAAQGQLWLAAAGRSVEDERALREQRQQPLFSRQGERLAVPYDTQPAEIWSFVRQVGRRQRVAANVGERERRRCHIAGDCAGLGGVGGQLAHADVEQSAVDPQADNVARPPQAWLIHAPGERLTLDASPRRCVALLVMAILNCRYEPPTINQPIEGTLDGAGPPSTWA